MLSGTAALVPYDLTTPQVYDATWSTVSAVPLRPGGSQLGDQEAARLTIKQQTAIPVLESQVQSSHLAPGEQSLGVVAVRPPSTTEPTVLRFQFANEDREQIAAFLVR